MIKSIPNICPLCGNEFITINSRKKRCNKCKSEWIFDLNTGKIKFVNFLENKKVEVG